MEELPQLLKVLDTSGPMGLLAVLLAAALWQERKDNRKGHLELLKLSKAQIAANAKLVSSIRALRELVRQIREQVQTPRDRRDGGAP